MNHVPRMTYAGEGPTSENPERGGIVVHFSGDQQRAALQATLQGTKYYKDHDLNKS